MKPLLIIASVCVIGAVILVAFFGTTSPCGILREVTRQREQAGIMPDIVIDAYLISQYGSLTPMKCIGLLLDDGRRGGAITQRAGSGTAAAIGTTSPAIASNPASSDSPTTVNPVTATAIAARVI